MIRLTRRYRFSASHRLHSRYLSDERNREVYGKCNNPFGHGHDYILEVSVRGPVDAETGMLIRVEDLDAVVRNEVLRDFHMRNLNLDVPEFRNMVPTSENVAVVVRRRLERVWSGVFGPWPALEKVRIQETPRNIFEVCVRSTNSGQSSDTQELVTKS